MVIVIHAYLYILIKGTITVTGRGADQAARQADERNKGVIFKNYVPLIDCMTEINMTEIDNAKDLDVVMPMYNLMEYNNYYSKPSGYLRLYYGDEANAALTDFESFKSKVKIATPNNVIQKML